ncbi:hypothetical protein GFS60_07966 (plasmid) [Rhodococcus sp. WAY2]|nr:hypothetical protein GFS60_07966 [Rhodococcus sp. WAY2]
MSTCHTLNTHVLLNTGISGPTDVDIPVPVRVRYRGRLLPSRRDGGLFAPHFSNKPSAPASTARHTWRGRAPAGKCRRFSSEADDPSATSLLSAAAVS